jgi:hypothetical protein
LEKRINKEKDLNYINGKKLDHIGYRNEGKTKELILSDQVNLN